jgi:hypothetical protein
MLNYVWIIHIFFNQNYLEIITILVFIFFQLLLYTHLPTVSKTQDSEENKETNEKQAMCKGKVQEGN